MKMKRKVMLSGLLALSAAACLSLGIAFQSDGAVNASAEGEITVSSVNTLGYLEWAAVDGAESYTVSSKYGEFTVTDTKANVGDAIVQAAKAAVEANAEATEATVNFTVTSDTGATGEYPYTFGSYIDYAFTKADFSEATTTAGTEVGDDGSISITGSAKTIGVGNAMTKNELFTFTWKTSVKLSTSTAQNTWIYMFGKDGCTWSNTSNSFYVWALKLTRTSATLYANGGENSAKNAANTRVELSTIITTTFDTGIDHKFTVGVFDTYGLNGVKAGETVYVRLDDATSGKLEDEGYYFASNEDLTTYGINEDGSDEYKGRSGFGICSPSTSYTYTVTAGNTYDATYGAPFYESDSLSLTLEGDIGVNWYVNSPVAVLNAEKAVAQITFKGATTEQPVTVKDGKCQISYSVLPKDIDEDITARVVIPGGPMGYEVTYSVRDYINLVEDTDKEAAVATALAAYCDAASNYFDETAEQPAEANKSAEAFAEYAANVQGEDENVTLYGVSLITETKTTLRLYFQVAEGAEMPTVTVDGEEATAVQSGSFYYVDVEDIAAQDLEKTYEFAVGGYTVTCCALTYGNLLSESDDNKTWSLMNALLAYYQAAENYFESEGNA